jgi:hypothetical protein
MERRALSASELDEWWSYYERAGRPGPYHRPDYLELLAGNFEHHDERPELFVLEDGDDIVYYPYIRRSLTTVSFAEQTDTDLDTYDDIVSSWYWGGPFASAETEDICERFAEAFTEYCQAENIVAEFVRFDPNERNHDRFECLDPSFNRETVRIDLTQSEEEIWENYEDRNQRAIRQARDTAITVEPTSDPEDVAAFHRIYSNAMDAKDASAHYRFEQSFFENLVRDSALGSLLVARYEGETIGGFIVAHDETVAHHYLSASNPEYWDMRVNNLLYHEVVMYCKDTGRRLFDFQGGRPGVFKFKKGFGPGRSELHLARRVHMDDTYADMVAEAESAGIDTDSGYFPAYRVELSN